MLVGAGDPLAVLGLDDHDLQLWRDASTRAVKWRRHELDYLAARVAVLTWGKG